MSEEVKPALKFLTFPGKIHLIKTDAELAAVSDQLLQATELGFDTETRPAFKKGESYNVALLQLATETDAFLIRLHFVKNFAVFKTVF